MLLISSLTLFADWSQTRQIARRDDLYEKNPIMGKYPSQAKVNTYFAAALAINISLKALPRKQRNIAWTALTIMQSVVITKNKTQLNLNVVF